MTIDLRAILRAQGRRRDLTLRPIQTTKTQADELARVYAPIIDAWREGVRDQVIPEYARSLAAFTGDSPADIEAEISSVENRAVQLILNFRSAFQGWANAINLWHVSRLGSQLTYATGVDLTAQLGGGLGTIEDALARNTALIRNVSDQTRGRVADIVFRGLQQRTPVKDVAKQINDAVGLGKERSLRIASDQTVKLSASLDQLRQRELGFDSFIWRHSGKRHFRPDHKARDGVAFSWDSEVAKTDPPGYAPFCGCKAIAHMAMDSEDAPATLPGTTPAPTPAPAPVQARPRARATPKPKAETAAQRTARLNEEGRSYVIANGKRENVEYLYAFDKSTGEVIDQYTSGGERFVAFSPKLIRAISDPKRKVVLRHNHPSSTSLSGQDTLMMGQFPGMAEMVADGIDGSYYHALRGRKKLTQKAVDSAQREARAVLQRQVNLREITPADAGLIESHLRNVRLNTLGYLKYSYRFEGGTAELVKRNADAIRSAEQWLK